MKTTRVLRRCDANTFGAFLERYKVLDIAKEWALRYGSVSDEPLTRDDIIKMIDQLNQISHARWTRDTLITTWAITVACIIVAAAICIVLIKVGVVAASIAWIRQSETLVLIGVRVGNLWRKTFPVFSRTARREGVKPIFEISFAGLKGVMRKIAPYVAAYLAGSTAFVGLNAAVADSRIDSLLPKAELDEFEGFLKAKGARTRAVSQAAADLWFQDYALAILAYDALVPFGAANPITEGFVRDPNKEIVVDLNDEEFAWMLQLFDNLRTKSYEVLQPFGQVKEGFAPHWPFLTVLGYIGVDAFTGGYDSLVRGLEPFIRR